MKIFMTGGTGNIGQYVTKELLERGHEIMLFTRTPDRIPAYLTMPGVTVVEGNMLDFDAVKKGMEGCDVVIHIALGWGNDPVNMLINDTRVTATLLDMAEQCGVKNFIFTSSTAALGNMEDGTNETSLRKPTDLYGATKASGEMFVLGFRQYYGPQGAVKMRRNIIRPGYTYSNPAVEGGASQSDQRFEKIAEALVNDQNLEFDINDGTQFLSSGQIAKVYADLAESDLNEEVFFALSENFVTWYDIACKAKELLPASKSVISARGTKHEPARYDVSKIKDVFGRSFDAWEDLESHIQWNIDRALAKKAGETVHNTNHAFS